MSTVRPARVDALIPLQKVLAAHGVRAHPWALADACGGDLSLTSFARCAEQQGLEARVTRLDPGDLRFVEVGALVGFDDGAVALVVAQGPGGVVVEKADGTTLRIGPRDATRPLATLVVGPPAPPGTRLLGRLSLLWRAEAHATRAVALATLLAVVVLALGLTSSMVTRAALGSALPDRATSTLHVLVAGTVLTGLQLAGVGFLRRRALRYLATKLSARASLEVVSHMLRLPFARLRALDVGAVQQAAGSAANAAEALPTIAPQALDAVLGVGYLAYTVSIDPASGALAALGGLVVVIAGAFSGSRGLALRRTLLARSRATQQGLYETLSSIETVKAEGIEGRMVARWLDRALSEQGAALAVRLQTSTATTLLASLCSFVFGGVLLLAARRCLAGSAGVADMMAAVQASASFMASAQTLAQVPTALAKLRSDVERADEVLVAEAERPGAPRPTDSRAPALVLRDVWFRYDDAAPWVLSGRDLVVRAGETVLLSWPSGAGKSTLLRILSGLLAPARGDALVFGMEATKARGLVTYIPQQAALFPGSLMDNLQILSRNRDKRRVLAAARATGLADLAASWGMGMETVVTGAGASLSSGQRQLVLLTAAVASATPIVLLDEALAHMDLSMRARLGGAGLFRGRTVIAVAHDASAREVGGARVVAWEDRRGAAVIEVA